MRPNFTFLFTFFFIVYLSRSLLSVFIAFILATVVSIVVRRVVFEQWLQWSEVKGAVVITGTSSGFGRLFVYILASKGLLVFAGVRKREDGEKLRNDAP